MGHEQFAQVFARFSATATSHPTGATRLQYRPVLRHIRSLIGPPTSDDERQSILLQFVVRTDSD